MNDSKDGHGHNNDKEEGKKKRNLKMQYFEEILKRGGGSIFLKENQRIHKSSSLTDHDHSDGDDLHIARKKAFDHSKMVFWLYFKKKLRKV